MIPVRARQHFFDDLFDGESSSLTCMTRLEWRDRDTVDYALWWMAEGKSIKDLARELALAPATLYGWRARADEAELWEAYK